MHASFFCKLHHARDREMLFFMLYMRLLKGYFTNVFWSAGSKTLAFEWILVWRELGEALGKGKLSGSVESWIVKALIHNNLHLLIVLSIRIRLSVLSWDQLDLIWSAAVAAECSIKAAVMYIHFISSLHDPMCYWRSEPSSCSSIRVYVYFTGHYNNYHRVLTVFVWLKTFMHVYSEVISSWHSVM